MSNKPINTTNQTIRLLITIESQPSNNASKSSSNQKNFMLPVSQQGLVKSLLERIQKSSPEGSVCQNISLQLSSGERFEVSQDLKIQDSFKDMDKVFVKANLKNKNVPLVKSEKPVVLKQKVVIEEQKSQPLKVVKPQNEKKQAPVPVQVESTMNKNKARRLKKQMEKKKEKDQQKQLVAEANKAVKQAAEAVSIKPASVQKVVPPSAKKNSTTPAKKAVAPAPAQKDKSAVKTPQKQAIKNTPSKSTPKAAKSPATPLVAKIQETPKVGKNAAKKNKRKHEAESTEKLRNEIYNGINNYSQEEALKSVSENEEVKLSKSLSKLSSDSDFSGTGPKQTASFLQQLNSLSNKIQSNSSSEASSFGSVGKL